MSSIDHKLEFATESIHGSTGKRLDPGAALPKQVVKWSAFAAFALFCVYRIATFNPEPLDAPTTLRPILNDWFLRFLHSHTSPAQALESWTRMCGLALLIPPVLAILNYGWRDKLKGLASVPEWLIGMLCSRWLLFGSMAVCLAMCRFPTLLENELNPDEGQFLASAHKLFYDANFFRSVDCGTSGPFNVYPLMLPAVFGFTPDFASSRVLVLLIILLSTYLLYRAVALIAPDDLARVASLSFFGAFSVFRGTELLHYSSEHTPILLISVALYWSVRILRSPRAYSIPVFVLGLLAGTGFFTKMQSVPILAALAAVALAFVYATGSNGGKLWRPVSLLVAGGMTPTILIVGLSVAGGVWRNFWISYIVSNWNSPNPVNGVTSALPEFVKFLFIADEVRFFLFTALALAVVYWLESRRGAYVREWKAFLRMMAISAIVIGVATFVRDNLAGNYSYIFFIAVVGIPMYLLLFLTEESLGGDQLQWFGFLSFASVASAFFSAYAPHRPFFHYLLFLFLPLCSLMSWILIRQCRGAETRQGSVVANKVEHRYGAQRPIAFVLLFVALIVAYQSYMWSFQDNGIFKHPVLSIRPPEADFIRSLTDSKAKIAVWGWTVRPYLGSGRVPATRDTNTSYSFRGLNLMTSPPEEDVRTPAEKKLSRYYRTRFLHDLEQSRAELFIDATGPASWFLTDRKTFTFERFPEIDNYVKANYVFVADRYGERFYLRRDLAGKG
jgi:hypothetical protein